MLNVLNMVIELWENDFVLRKDKVKYLGWIALMSATESQTAPTAQPEPKSLCVGA